MKEEWRFIDDKKHYSVSDTGKVLSHARIIIGKDGRKINKKENMLTVTVKQGYPAVSISSMASGKICVHTLVAMAFLGKRPDWARTVNHKDGNKNNNNVGNLEWASYQDNNRHARRMLLNKQHGEKCNLTKFSDDVVDAVIILCKSKRFTHSEIGCFFKMSAIHVSEIYRGVSRVKKTAY